MAKIELAKAYDYISWDFIVSFLRQMALPNQLISLLWNGNKSSTFSRSKGIHQKGPFSSHLFIIAMESLSRKIEAAMNNGTWKPDTICRGSMALSHLFFVDDVLIFLEVEIGSATCIAMVL